MFNRNLKKMPMIRICMLIGQIQNNWKLIDWQRQAHFLEGKMIIDQKIMFLLIDFNN